MKGGYRIFVSLFFAATIGFSFSIQSANALDGVCQKSASAVACSAGEFAVVSSWRCSGGEKGQIYACETHDAAQAKFQPLMARSKREAKELKDLVDITSAKQATPGDEKFKDRMRLIGKRYAALNYLISTELKRYDADPQLRSQRLPVVREWEKPDGLKKKARAVALVLAMWQFGKDKKAEIEKQIDASKELAKTLAKATVEAVAPLTAAVKQLVEPSITCVDELVTEASRLQQRQGEIVKLAQKIRSASKSGFAELALKFAVGELGLTTDEGEKLLIELNKGPPKDMGNQFEKEANTISRIVLPRFADCVELKTEQKVKLDENGQPIVKQFASFTIPELEEGLTDETQKELVKIAARSALGEKLYSGACRASVDQILKNIKNANTGSIAGDTTGLLEAIQFKTHNYASGDAVRIIDEIDAALTKMRRDLSDDELAVAARRDLSDGIGNVTFIDGQLIDDMGEFAGRANEAYEGRAQAYKKGLELFDRLNAMRGALQNKAKDPNCTAQCLEDVRKKVEEMKSLAQSWQIRAGLANDLSEDTLAISDAAGDAFITGVTGFAGGALAEKAVEGVRALKAIQALAKGGRLARAAVIGVESATSGTAMAGVYTTKEIIAQSFSQDQWNPAKMRGAAAEGFTAGFVGHISGAFGGKITDAVKSNSAKIAAGALTSAIGGVTTISTSIYMKELAAHGDPEKADKMVAEFVERLKKGDAQAWLQVTQDLLAGAAGARQGVKAAEAAEHAEKISTLAPAHAAELTASCQSAGTCGKLVADLERLSTVAAKDAYSLARFQKDPFEFLKTLPKEEIATFTALDTHTPTFGGPPPTRRAPNPQELANAVHRHSNGTASKADYELIIDSVISTNRGALEKGSPDLSAKNLTGESGAATWDVTRRLRAALGNDVEVFEHQASKVFGGDKTPGHVFTVIKTKSGETYLIDTTFKQFFDAEKTAPGEAGAVGKRLRSTKQGSALADELLEKGYVSLTDQSASLLAKAFTDKKSAKLAVSDLAKKSTFDTGRGRYDSDTTVRAQFGEVALVSPGSETIKDALLGAREHLVESDFLKRSESSDDGIQLQPVGASPQAKGPKWQPPDNGLQLSGRDVTHIDLIGSNGVTTQALTPNSDNQFDMPSGYTGNVKITKSDGTILVLDPRNATTLKNNRIAANPLKFAIYRLERDVAGSVSRVELVDETGRSLGQIKETDGAFQAPKDPRYKIRVTDQTGKVTDWDPQSGSPCPTGLRPKLNKKTMKVDGLSGCHTVDCFDDAVRRYPDPTNPSRNLIDVVSSRHIKLKIPGGADVAATEKTYKFEGSPVAKPKTVLDRVEDIEVVANWLSKKPEFLDFFVRGLDPGELANFPIEVQYADGSLHQAKLSVRFSRPATLAGDKVSIANTITSWYIDLK